MKTAILQVADTGPLESLVIMLRSVGYKCYLPNHSLKEQLRSLKCRVVLNIADLIRTMGYDKPLSLPEASPEMMDKVDLYVDVKGHVNGPIVEKRWPHLKGKILWYRINGGKPEHVINQRGDHGNEVNPPCPVLTPNQWYGEKEYNEKAYCCWPPFYRADEYFPKYGRHDPITDGPYDSPLCLIHNLEGWGYGRIIDGVRKLGVKCYGESSPDGLIPHSAIPRRLSRALCSVHLKSSDAPGYAIYECLAAACPLICTRRLIWRCRMQELLIPGETCLVFDRETHEGLTDEDVKTCLFEIEGCLEYLKNPENNRRIGLNGMRKLQEVTWKEDKDSQSLKEWLERMYP